MEAGCGDEIGGEILHARTNGSKQDGVANYADGRCQNEWEEACLVAIREVGTDGVDNGAPYVDGNDEKLCLEDIT